MILCTEVTTGLRLRWSRLQRDTKVLGCRRDIVHRSDNRLRLRWSRLQRDTKVLGCRRDTVHRSDNRLRLRWSRLQRDTKVLGCRRDTVHRSDNRTPTQMEQVAKRHESPWGAGVILCTEVTATTDSDSDGAGCKETRKSLGAGVILCTEVTTDSDSDGAGCKETRKSLGAGVILCTEVTTGLRLRWSRLQRDTKVLGCRRDTVHRSDSRTPTQMEQVAKRHESPSVQA